MIKSALCLPKISDDSQEIQPKAVTPGRATGLASQVFQSTQELPWDDWHRIVSPENTLWNREFYQAMEATSSPHTQHYYVLMYEYGKPIFCSYFQQIPFETRQISNFTQDVKGGNQFGDWGKSRLANVTRRLVQLFRVRLLVNGTPMLTGETGFQALPSLSSSRIQSLLFMATEAVEAQAPRSIGTLVKDLRKADQDTSWDSVLTQKAYHQFLPDPEMKFSVPSSWHTWEDYLGAMTSKYRQRVKSAYKKSKDILHRELSLSELTAYQDQLYQLFQQILSQEKFSLCETKPDFLFQLKSALQDRFLVQGYFLEEKLIGFTSQLISEEGLLTHFVGFDKSLNSSKKLYQRMLYDQIQQALSLSGTRPFTLSLGRTAMEIKSAIGALPETVPCYLRLRPSWLNRLAAPILANLKIEVWTPRHPFKQPVQVH